MNFLKLLQEFGKRLKEFLCAKRIVNLNIDQHHQRVSDGVYEALISVIVEGSAQGKDLEMSECEVLLDILKKNLPISEADILDLIGKALDNRKREKGIDLFARRINEFYSDEQKIYILSLIWRVVLADGNVDTIEQRYISQIRFRMMLTEDQAEQAKVMSYQNL